MPLFTIDADGKAVAVIAAEHQAQAIKITASEWDNLVEVGAFSDSAKEAVRGARSGGIAFWEGLVPKAITDGEMPDRASASEGNHTADSGTQRFSAEPSLA